MPKDAGNIAFAIRLANSLKKAGYNSNFLITRPKKNDQEVLAKLNTNILCVKEVPKDCSICFAVIDFTVTGAIFEQLKGKKIIVLSQYDMEIENEDDFKKLKSLGAEVIKTGVSPKTQGIF